MAPHCTAALINVSRSFIVTKMCRHGLVVASSAIECLVLVSCMLCVDHLALRAGLAVASLVHMWGTRQIWDNNLWPIVSFICAQEYECLVVLVGMWALNYGCVWKSLLILGIMFARLQTPLVSHAFHLVNIESKWPNPSPTV